MLDAIMESDQAEMNLVRKQTSFVDRDDQLKTGCISIETKIDKMVKLNHTQLQTFQVDISSHIDCNMDFIEGVKEFSRKLQ